MLQYLTVGISLFFKVIELCRKRKEVAIKGRNVNCASIYYCNFFFVVKDKEDFLNAFCTATSKSTCGSSLKL